MELKTFTWPRNFSQLQVVLALLISKIHFKLGVQSLFRLLAISDHVLADKVSMRMPLLWSRVWRRPVRRSTGVFRVCSFTHFRMGIQFRLRLSLDRDKSEAVPGSEVWDVLLTK